jgi:hypothetical protein
MKKKPSLILDDEFIQYCELNKIKTVNKLAKETFDRGFSILKFGETPSIARGRETIKEVEKEIIKEIEVIKEVRVEVPVEVIKEVKVEVPVEVIKEVPIKGDTKTITKEVIKEVVVEKPVYVTDDKEIKQLREENQKLKEELDKITSSLSNLNKAKYLKNSNLNSLYDE